MFLMFLNRFILDSYSNPTPFVFLATTRQLARHCQDTSAPARFSIDPNMKGGSIDGRRILFSSLKKMFTQIKHDTSELTKKLCFNTLNLNINVSDGEFRDESNILNHLLLRQLDHC